MSTKLPEQTSWSVLDVGSDTYRPTFIAGRFYKFTWNESMYRYMEMSERSGLFDGLSLKQRVSLATVQTGSVLFYLGSEEFACGWHMTNDKCTSYSNIGLQHVKKGTGLKFLHNGQILYLHSDYLLELLRIDEVELD